MRILPGKGEDALARSSSLGISNLLLCRTVPHHSDFLTAISEGGQVAVPGRIPRWEWQPIFRCLLKAQPSVLCWSSTLGLWTRDTRAVGSTGMKGSRAGVIWEGVMAPGI